MDQLSRRGALIAGCAWAAAALIPENLRSQTSGRGRRCRSRPNSGLDAAGTIKLDARTGTMRFLGDRDTATYGINGPYLGPALRLRRGETVTAHVTNNVPENITVHWHGLIIPGDVDGGPHQVSRRESGGRRTWRSTSPRRRSGSIRISIRRRRRRSSRASPGW